MSVAGEGYSVDLAHLDDVTARMRALKAFVIDQLTALDTKAQAAMTSWNGEAATAYQVAHQEWADGATDVQEGLQVLEKAAQTAHGNYTSAVAANLKRLGQ
ncbi:WXG100 family type VII secretion target [Nocardia sp. 2]|uniref:ESAT-6-like protein n=1 Tax=Nocardia acididurans TaxID=2802282 RepID=A0ABS1M3K2_9NOCA|nr:WXG100 family type VII secretion target [Nocardia acididurans]MBL1075242.1 WXG100 family type VII secretion target [Nocardia acididurans]